MATLTMTLSKTDLMAALQAWIAAQPGNHQMNMLVTPVFDPQAGGMIIALNQ